MSAKPYVLAAVLSAFAPGVGHLILGQRRKGAVLLALFGAILLCYWPVRLPRFFAAFVLLLLTWMVLLLYALCSVLLARSEPAPTRPSRWWLVAILPVAYIGINAVFTPTFLAAGFRARKFGSSSMETTLLQGDMFVIDRSYYQRHPVGRNDLVLMIRNNHETVKRVIAVGGDTIEAKDRQVKVNGHILTEPFIQHSAPIGDMPDLDTFGPVTIPVGKYFVMGDNRDLSLDSRTPDFGLVDAQAILGRPLYIYRSPVRARLGRRLD